MALKQKKDFDCWDLIQDFNDETFERLPGYICEKTGGDCDFPDCEYDGGYWVNQEKRKELGFKDDGRDY